MRKIVSLLICGAIALSLCGCGKVSEPEPTPVLEASELVTAEDVANTSGYTPVTEPSGTGREGNVSTILYRSEPIGQYDTVTVKVTQFNDDIDYQTIYDAYEQEKATRSTAEPVESLGQDAYIAFPSIHVYDRGCVIDITAGSGSDDTQKNLLKTYAMLAASRLEEIIPEYKEQ